VWTNNLEHGQTNLVILMLLVGSFWLAERGRMRLAGALVAIAGTFKLFPFLATLYFLRRRATALLAATAIVTAVLWVLPLARGGVGPYAADLGIWRARTIARFAPGQTVGPGTMNQSVPAMMERLMGAGEGAAERIRVASLLCQLAVCVALVSSLRRGSRPDGAAAVREFAGFAALLAAMPLLSGLSWKAHYVMLLPGWFVLLAPEIYRGRVGQRASEWLRGLAFAIGAVLILTSDGVVGRGLSERFQNASIFTLSGILIFAMLVYLVTRPSRPDAREPASPGRHGGEAADDLRGPVAVRP
jgi:hypothetical protein